MLVQKQRVDLPESIGNRSAAEEKQTGNTRMVEQLVKNPCQGQGNIFITVVPFH